jgi:hypothetical protein
MEKFASLQEILDMYCISWKLVRNILRHHKIDFYKQEDIISINLKEFYQIYTANYNPALFTIEEKKPIIKSHLLQNLKEQQKKKLL